MGPVDGVGRPPAVDPGTALDLAECLGFERNQGFTLKRY